MKIEVYGTTGCPYCQNAKKWLTENGYEFTEISLDDVTLRSAFKAANPKLATVPQIFITDASGVRTHIGGYSDLIRSPLFQKAS
jgi:glutaredoxin